MRAILGLSSFCATEWAHKPLTCPWVYGAVRAKFATPRKFYAAAGSAMPEG